MRRELLILIIGPGSYKVRYAIRGAAELRVQDVLGRMVELLTHPARNVRLGAATAVGTYGAKADVYLTQLRDALESERDPVVQRVLAESVKLVSPK